MARCCVYSVLVKVDYNPFFMRWSVQLTLMRIRQRIRIQLFILVGTAPDPAYKIMRIRLRNPDRQAEENLRENRHEGRSGVVSKESAVG
jgi:hypothetical protein